MDGGWVFASQDRVDPMTPRQLNREIHAAAQSAGIDKRVSTHTLRHSFATICWNRRTTSASSRCCSGTGSSRRRRSTRMWPPRCCARSSARSRAQPTAVRARAWRARPGGGRHLPPARAGLAPAMQRGHLIQAQLNVMSAIEQCRTAALGGHCRGATTAATADRLQLLPQPPLPQVPGLRRAALARGPAGRPAAGRVLPRRLHAAGADRRTSPTQNKARRLRPAVRAAAETLRTIAADPRHLGAEIGFRWSCTPGARRSRTIPTSTASSRAAGLSPDGQRWVACRPGFFLPVRVLSRLFRRLFLAALAPGSRRRPAAVLRAARRAGRPGRLRRMARAAAPAEWVVYAKPPFGGPRRCSSTWAATRTGSPSPIACWSSFDERGVTFRWKDYGPRGARRQKMMTLGHRRVHPPLPAARAARAASSASATTACWPMARKDNLAATRSLLQPPCPSPLSRPTPQGRRHRPSFHRPSFAGIALRR